MTVVGGWMLQAHGKSKADVKAELEAAKVATLEGAKENGDAIDKEIVQQMDVAIAAATAAAKLFKGKGAVDVSAAGSSHEKTVRLIIVASRGGGS